MELFQMIAAVSGSNGGVSKAAALIRRLGEATVTAWSEDDIRGGGYTPAQAARIKAAIKWGHACAYCVNDSGVALPSSTKCVRVLRPYLTGIDVEKFYILCMNRANKLLAVKHISSGGVTGTVADAKVIFRAALATPTCTSLVLAHNHPSGNAQPSAADIRLTTKIGRAARSLDLHVLDHVILTDAGPYYSFADNGMIEGQ